MFNDINYTYEELASILVPETLKNNNPEFYDLIKAFTKNIMSTKKYYENGYSRLLDINKITNEDIIKIYLDTYAKTLNINSEQENVILLKDIIKISKDLSVAKGTVYLFNLLAGILKYLLRDVNTVYDDLVESLNNPNLTEEEKELILEQINNQQTYTENDINITETSAYHYEIVSILTRPFIEQYILPFCHPTGWVYDIIQVVTYIYTESARAKDNLSIYSTLKIPVPVIGDDFSIDLFTENCPNIFEYYYGDIELGEDYEYTEILGKTYNTDRIYVANGKTYYSLSSPSLLASDNNLVKTEIIDKNYEAFYKDDSFDNSLLYRTSGTFARDYDGMTMNNGLVIAGDRIVFKYNWEVQQFYLNWIDENNENWIDENGEVWIEGNHILCSSTIYCGTQIDCEVSISE